MSENGFKKRAWKRLLINLLMFPVFMGFAVDGDGGGAEGGTDGQGNEGNDGGDVGGEGAAGADGDAKGGDEDGGSDGQEPTYEELTAQSKELADKAEALRVSKLTDEEKAAEEKAKQDAEEAAKADKVPEEYEAFKVPEGMPVDEALLNDFKPIAKELGLSQTKAQKLIDLYAEKAAPAMIQRQQDQWTETLEGWKTACKSDKEIGGDKFDTAVSDAQRVVNTIGTPELKEVFNTYGLGNNPEIVRVFTRMAKYLKEDTMISGGSSGAGENIAQRMYPGMNP